MAEFTNLSSMKVAGSVETSYQGKLIGTFANEDALPTASGTLDGLIVYLESKKEYRRCNGSDWSTVVGKIHTDAEIQAPATEVQNNLNDAKTDLQGQITANDGDISTLQSDMTTAKGNITTLQSDVSTAKGNITTLQGNITTITGDIADLESNKADNSDLAGYVPTSRTVNGKALTGNITLSAADVGAVTSSGSVASATKATQDGNGNVITATYATKSELTNAVSSVYKAKGSVSALPTSGMVDGDVYNLTVAKDNYPAGTNWLYHDGGWDALSGLMDLTGYTTDAEHTALASRVSTAESNITTVTSTANTNKSNIESLTTKVNNLESTGGQANVIEAVKVNGTALPVSSKAVNIDLSGYTTDSEHTALSTRVTTAEGEIDTLQSKMTTAETKLNGIASGAQVNVIEAVKVNGTALTPTSKVVDITVPTNNNQLTNGAGYVTASGSVASATSATKATQDASGNVITTTYATKTELNSKQNTLTFDSTPTSGSTNPVTSGGVYSAINTINQSLSTLEGKVENLEGEVSTAKSYVTINVTSNTGNITGRVITATPAEGSADTTATVGSGGSVTMTLNATSQYTLGCDAPSGYYAVPDQTITTAAAGLVTNVTFTLVRKPVVNVVVTDASDSGHESGRTLAVTGAESATLTSDSSGKASHVFSTTGDVTFAMTDIPTDGDCDPQTITIANDMEYTVYLEISFGFIVGVKIKLSDGTVEYTDDATGFTAASGTNLGDWVGHKLLEGFKPVQRSSVGVFTDLNPNDLTKTSSGGTSSITSTAADAFLEVPLTWMHLSKDSTYGYIKFSNKQVDSTYTANAFYGSDGALKNCFHYGLFFSKNSSSKAYCYGNVAPTGSVSLSNWISFSQARGEFFDLTTYCMDTFLIAMFVVLYKSLNGQAALAKGYTGGSEVQSNTILSFTSNNYGMAGSTSSTTTRMAFLWIHDFWGNMNQWVGGMSSNSSYKCCVQVGELCSSSNSSMDATPYGQSGVTGGYISSVAFDNDAGFYPLADDGSSSTLFADRGYVYASYFPRRGGNYDYGGRAGPFFLDVDGSASYPDSGIGARLSYRGGRA